MSARFNFHWQNLANEASGRSVWPWHGRAWLRLWTAQLRLEWNLWSNGAGLSVSTDQENGLTFGFRLPPVSLWFGIEPRGVFRWKEREWSLRFFDWAVWWMVGTNPMGHWSGRPPKWREGNWHYLDTLLGRSAFSERVVSEHAVSIPMPEGSYPASIRLKELTWKRPRWFAKRGRYASVDMEIPIPHEGKGENSWDCGKDALHGLHTQATTVEDAIASTVRAALRGRRRYDGNVMAEYPAPGVP